MTDRPNRANRDRPAKNPGGMVCEVCSEVFIGAEWHARCAICAQPHRSNPTADESFNPNRPHSFQYSENCLARDIPAASCQYPECDCFQSSDVTEHTPGPWTIEEYGDDDAPALVIHKDSDNRICFMATPGSHGDPAKIEADARLIAAAPDMLAMLDQIAAVCTDNMDQNCNHRMALDFVRQVVRAAIARAEGKQP